MIDLHYEQHVLEIGRNKKLPEAYKNFYREWKYKEKIPVHYISNNNIYEKNDDGQTVPVQNVPLPLLYTTQMENGIWGGEWIVQGFRKKHPKKPKVPKFWMPKLLNGVIYSEVLNKHMRTVITPRAIELINEHYGLDNYLLKSPACDLATLLSLKLKRKILHALYYKTLYPENEEQRTEVYDRYKRYLENYTEEDIIWYGLTIDEAHRKMGGMIQVEKENSIVPLKHKFRKEFVEKLKSDPSLVSGTEKSWWRKTLFPF